jgi:membrane-bound inhibitor of C-type lysozyme
MHRLLTIATRAALPAALAACISACGGKHDAEPPPVPPAPSAAATTAPEAIAQEPGGAMTTAATKPDVAATADAQAVAALPEGVKLYYAWDCDGGLHLVMKNLIQDRAVSLETHEGSRKLPQAVSASGVRYTDGTVTFWTKGDTATYQREGGTLLNCRLAANGNTHP